MYFRHKTTKDVREVNGNSEEGRALAKDAEWDKIDGPNIDEPELPPGVVQPPEPSAD